MLALSAAYDPDSDSNNIDEESEVEREVAKGEDPVPPLKRGLDQVLDKEIMTEMVKSDCKKNIVKEKNLGESLNVLIPKVEPKDEYGEFEQIPGASFGAVSLKREPNKEEYSEFEAEAGRQQFHGVSPDGHGCKKKPKVEPEVGEAGEEQSYRQRPVEEGIPHPPPSTSREKLPPPHLPPAQKRGLLGPPPLPVPWGPWGLTNTLRPSVRAFEQSIAQQTARYLLLPLLP